MTVTKTASDIEKIKPFKLVKYFSFTSLFLAFIGTVVLSFLNTQWVRSMQQKKSKDYAHVLIENLNHQIFMQFSIPVFIRYGKIQLSDPKQFEIMDRVVKSTLHSFSVESVNIYDMNRTISYSLDASLIGQTNMGGDVYPLARDGQLISKEVHDGGWLIQLLGLSQTNQMITFAPLRAELPLSGLSGPVLGVIEIVQDLSEDYNNIFRFQISVIIASTVVMSALLSVLIFVVKRGEKIMELRALERLRLIEKLNRAQHLSSLGEMVAAVSHEIRNPLGIIRSSAELLKKKVAAIDAENHIPDIIVEESTRLNHIITDFLDYARPKEPVRLPYKINEIIEKNINFLSSQLENNGFVVEKSLDQGIPELTGDPDMLYQAFLNIWINAMQAMPEGGTIRVSTMARDETAIIRVEDTGEGIPDNLTDKIWDPFYTTKDKGTGLGLGIVNNIIRAHDGRITIANRTEGGACVEVVLPTETGNL